MTPFTRRVDPAVARAVSSTSRAVAVVAGVYCLVLSTLLVANYVQLAALHIQDNPELAALREQYRQAPADDELAARIRALDMLARKAYFTRRWQIVTGAWMLAGGVVLLVASLRLHASMSSRLPRPQPERDDAESGGAERRSARLALSVGGAAVLVAAFAAAVLGARAAGPEPGTPEVAAGGAASGSAGPELTATEAYRSNWPQFRGPGGIGVAGSAEPPLDWDGPSGRNVAWKAEVPLPGMGSPVVWGERVFLSGADRTRRELYCWSAATGELLWRRAVEEVPGSPSEPPRVSEDTGYAASTMALDGAAAYAAFATGDIAAVDFGGAVRWTRNLGTPEQLYGFASSLALYGRSVIVQIDQEAGGRIVALDTATGNTLWETPRRVVASYCSPIVVSTLRRTMLVANGNPILAAYDPATGRLLWQVEGMAGEIGPSPAFADGRVIANDQMLKLLAVDAGRGTILWEYSQELVDVSSPLAAGGLVVGAASYGVLFCLDAASGEEVWKQSFETGFYASPILAGGRIYAVDRSGVTRIVGAGREGELLGSPAIGERVDATPAFAGRRIFIRGDRHLFCVESRGG